MKRRPLIVATLAVGVAYLLGACSSRPELVALKDASVYSGTQTELVDAEDRVEIAIGGVRVVKGGALVDVIVSVRPEPRNRIDKALDAFTGGPEQELRRAKGNLEAAATMPYPVRITGDDGPVRVNSTRLKREDPEANYRGGFLWATFICPKSAEFNCNGRTYIVQPVAVATRGPLKSGEYTVELTEHFMWWIIRPQPGEPQPAPYSARVLVETPGVPPAPSLDGF